MEQEIWKDIKNFEGLYQVSNLGRVKSLDRVVIYKNGRKRLFKGKVKNNIFNKKRGYYYITLSKQTKKFTFSIHKLVADNFLGYKEGKVVDHIDNDRTNNNLSNLRFITQRENLSKREDSGICYHIRHKKWTAHIWLNNKINHLGYFDNKEDAKQARLNALKNITNE